MNREGFCAAPERDLSQACASSPPNLVAPEVLLEEFQAILVEAVDYHREEHEQRERGRDDDVAYDREGAGNADYVRDQDKHEQRVVSGKNFIPSAPALERIIVATNS